MQLPTLQLSLLTAVLALTGCSLQPNPDRAASVNELMRVQTAFQELQNESGTVASDQGLTQRVNDTFTGIGDLANSERVADLGLPEDKVVLVYGYFHHAEIAYTLATQFVGVRRDEPSNKITDSTSDGEKESLHAAFPELDPVDILSRRSTLYDLLQIARDQTRAAEGMIMTLS